ncbi:MAG TPA: hypothetical protein VHM26_16605, partial [Chitinophagaceae bacterium]|nr:hypothetical protein [Chitinophagaceae bacterium]
GACMLFIACDKDPVDQTGKYLKYSNATTHIANQQGSFNSFSVESNVKWQLSVSGNTTNWVALDKYSGNGNDAIKVTALQSNNTSGYRFANVTATAIDDPSIAPVYLTIVQYDSTIKSH